MSDELVIPTTGELVPLDDPGRVAHALWQVRDLKSQLDQARRVLEEVLVEEARRQGIKTLQLGDAEAQVTGGTKLVWDHDTLAQLQDLGLPQERYDQLMKTVIEYKVDAAVAKQIEASGNDDYTRVIQAARTYEPAPWRVYVTLANKPIPVRPPLSGG